MPEPLWPPVAGTAASESVAAAELEARGLSSAKLCGRPFSEGAGGIMNRSLHAAVIGVVLHGLACAPTGAQMEPAVPAASNGESRAILGGKFLTVAPKDSVIKPRDHSIMAAPTSQLVEDNLWVERGGF